MGNLRFAGRGDGKEETCGETGLSGNSSGLADACMDGIETARKIREQIGEDITILIISAYDWSGIEEEAKQAGVNGFISKPLFKSTLYYGLSHFMETGEEGAEKKEETMPDYTGRRLLVAEDNELNWEIACELLSSCGFELDWAENGEKCVELFRKSGRDIMTRS